MRAETLYCTEGRSDKQYTVTLNEVAGGFAVVCFNGRRGGPQSTQNKTPQPVDAATADKLYAKIIREKLAKGYQPGAAAATMANGTSSIPAAPIRRDYQPMLLNAIGAAEAERYLCQPEWFMQQKADGVRCVVQVSGWQSLVVALSRTGKPVALTAEITSALVAAFPTDAILDCESCGTTLVVFDLLSDGGEDLRGLSCESRLDRLSIRATGRANAGPISFMQTARTGPEKRRALQFLRDGGAEGVVFKDRRAPYSAGKAASGGTALKWKFVASVSVVVSSVNEKRSVTMELADGTEVGSVTIPLNHEVPSPGYVIEVEYLYAHRGGSLIQPVYKGVRSDVEADGADSLQYKGEER